MAHARNCAVCGGRGYHHCACWPGDCICGEGDRDCEECGGTGYDDDEYPDDLPSSPAEGAYGGGFDPYNPGR